MWSVTASILLLLMPVPELYGLQEVNQSLSDQFLRCPPGFLYNSRLDDCECIQVSSVRCFSDNEAFLDFSSCMTHEEAEGTFIGFCLSFRVHGRNVTDRVYLGLPGNVTELNDYMCGVMNRRGIVCSECLEGFSPAITSFGFQCSNCTNAWYGVPLFLLLEFVPSTIFYLIVVAFGFSVTSAPMTSFVLYSQLAAHLFTAFTVLTAVVENEYGNGMIYFIKVITSLYGIWNLDFFRYLIPPFCISPQLKLLHVFFLYYISAFYPLCLIGITWTCIQLHSRNFKPITWIWKHVRRCGCSKRKTTDSRGTAIDVFATFFLLSYTKLLYTSLYLLLFINITKNGLPFQAGVAVDPSIKYFSKEHAPFAVIALLILIGPVIVPVTLLALYPVRSFRSLLERCKISGHSRAAVNLFVEKFYSCYRDGLDGGRDMRSFVFLQFFLRLSIFIGVLLQSLLAFWFFHFLLFGGSSLLIAIVQPYKRSYMSIIDSLILAILSLTGVLFILYLNLGVEQSQSPTFFLVALSINFTLPLIGFSVIVVVKFLHRWIPNQWKRFYKRQFHKPPEDVSERATAELPENQRSLRSDGVTTTDVELPDRLLHPYRYMGDPDETQ